MLHDIFYPFGQNVLSLLIGLISFSALIVIHEFGHLLFCKLFNVKVPTFSVGFGPTLVSKRVGETEFRVSAIPLGGYIDVARHEDFPTEPQQRFLDFQPLYKKLLVMFGGIMFNLIFAYAALCLLFMLGLPKTALLYPDTATTTIAHIAPNSPAEQLGLQVGDTFVEKDTVPVDHALSLTESPFKSSTTIKRNDSLITIQTPCDKNLSQLGITLALREETSHSFLDAVGKGIRLTNKLICKTATLLISVFTKRDASGLGGPIMIIAATTTCARAGFKVLIALLALLSISLAVLNLLPLPILDGGQILFALIEAIMGRPIPTRIREYIAIGNWIIFLGLFIYFSVQDVMRLKHIFSDSIFVKGWTKLSAWIYKS